VNTLKEVGKKENTYRLFPDWVSILFVGIVTVLFIFWGYCSSQIPYVNMKVWPYLTSFHAHLMYDLLVPTLMIGTAIGTYIILRRDDKQG